MKTTLITYSAKNLNRTEASKLSKKLIGYTDKSNNSKYTYKREGLITATKHIIIAKSAFIVPKNKANKIINNIKKTRAKILSWDIEILEKHFTN